MDGSDLIALSGRLVASKSASEASDRTAVSRAYYGSFHVASAFLSELGFVPLRNANVHAFVRKCLYESGHPDARIAARELGDLQSARNRADYQLNDTEAESRGYAILNVERAHRVVSALNRCQEESSRDTIRHGIAEYVQKIQPR
jgi:uncharacterized protein (UPF0332 family)